MNNNVDTIAAIATPPGRGGVGIVRISGPLAAIILKKIFNRITPPREAVYGPFADPNGEVIDIGLALYFPNPNSFTGEDVVELHGHGGPVVLDRLLNTALLHGARIARPGEFSERAFLNDKIDLAQAEAIADLIDSVSEQAARSAVRSLQGEFSKKINHLVEEVTHLRMYVEAAIDFPEEEIDFLSDGKVQNDIENILAQLKNIIARAEQGTILRDGLTVVIAGRPNAGKSTLLNCLSGRDSAIVTDIPGTTRDVMREYILIDGIPLHVIDTAGLRVSSDKVEQEGIRRAYSEMEKADRLLLLIDHQEYSQLDSLLAEVKKQIPTNLPITIICNKIDLTQQSAGMNVINEHDVIFLSAKNMDGLQILQQYLKDISGFQATESQFIARRRHLDALNKALNAIETGKDQLLLSAAGELLAEDLRQAQESLSEITGRFTADDLLGKIFSSFCIGK